MNTRNLLISGGTAVLLLVTVACGSKSTAAVASSSSSSSSAAASTLASVAPTLASVAPASKAASSAPDSLAPVSSGGAAPALDAVTTAWFTTLCTGLLPLSDAATKMAAIGTAGDDAAKLTAISEPQLAMGKIYTDVAAALTPLGAPTFNDGSDYATKTIAAFVALGSLFDAAGTAAAKGDGSKTKTMEADTGSNPALAAAAKVALAPALKAEMLKQIPVCVTSGAFA